MARKKRPRKSLSERIAPIRQAVGFTRQRDPKLFLWLALSFVVPFLVVLVVGIVLGLVWFFVLPAILVGVLVALIVFGRRANAAAYREAEGKPGAAVAIMQSLRGDWRVTPVVAANPYQDMVHRVLGRPGVVLIAEGNPQRVRGMLAAEKKRTVRVAGDVPVYDMVIGEGGGADEVSIRKLTKTMTKLPRNLQPVEVTALEKRMKALAAPQNAMPKGPLPKGAKMPRSVKGQKVPPPPGR